MLEKVEILKLEQYIGGQVLISGIVEKIEDHGGILFLEIKDLSALASAVIIPDKEKAFAMAGNLKLGYLIEISGIVKKSPLTSQDFACEIEVENLAIISARTRIENMIKIAGRE
jgi:aspartyl/asparaginyl-tRNA synthetase